jgi:hypothetical protein
MTAGIGNVPVTFSLAATGDYNGDGLSDLLWRDTGGNTFLWFMSGTQVLSSGAIGNIPTTWMLQNVNADWTARRARFVCAKRRSVRRCQRRVRKKVRGWLTSPRTPAATTTVSFPALLTARKIDRPNHHGMYHHGRGRLHRMRCCKCEDRAAADLYGGAWALSFKLLPVSHSAR